MARGQNQNRPMPKLLGLNKVDPMLGKIFPVFDLVLFKLHIYTPLAYLVKGGLNLRLTAHSGKRWAVGG